MRMRRPTAPLPTRYGALRLRHSHISKRRTHPFPSWLAKAARRAGWGMARCSLARPQERAFDDAFLLSAPHPSGFARHPWVCARGQALPHFVEKGRATA